MTVVADPPQPTDADLLRLAAVGNRAALGELARRYVDLVFAAAVRQTRDPSAADDVTQAVFLVLARRAGAVGPAALPAWLVQTARYAAANARRAERRQRRRERAAARAEAVMSSDVVEPDPLLPRLDDAIASLSAADRTAVVDRYLLGRDVAAVAAV